MKNEAFKFRIELSDIDKEMVTASMFSTHDGTDKSIFRKVSLTQMELTTLVNRLVAKVVWTKNKINIQELKALFNCRIVVYDKDDKFLLSENIDKLKKYTLDEQTKLGKRV